MRRSVLPISRATFLVFASALTVETAQAQQCDRPDLLDTIPTDLATDVPTNAKLFARYDRRAEYTGETVLFGPAGEEPTSFEAFFNENEGLLEVAPPEGLVSGRKYRVEWPELRGISTASRGRGAIVEFTAGEAPDTRPPRFAGVEGVSWSLDRDRDDCTDRADERLLFEIDLASPSDDGTRESLMLVVFQTAGPDIDEATAATPVLVRAMPEKNRVRVRLPLDETVGRVCFAAIVRDLAGFASASGSVEECTTTEAPPFFHGCSIRGPRTRQDRGTLLVFSVILYVALRRPPRGKSRAP
jgi:hypothetical protein